MECSGLPQQEPNKRWLDSVWDCPKLLSFIIGAQEEILLKDKSVPLRFRLVRMQCSRATRARAPNPGGQLWDPLPHHQI